MASIIEICNSALITLGANTITSLDENISEAISCNAKWNIARRTVLNTHPWSFATKREVLPAEVGKPAWGYEYHFQLPADNLRILRVDEDLDYKKEGNRILSNRDSCLIKFVYDNTITEQWSASFTDVMVSRMAYELAYTIPRTRTMIDAQYSIYMDKLEQAKYIDSSEDIVDDFGQFDDSLINIRY